MSIDDVISLKSRSWKRGGEGNRGRTLDQWSFEKQVAGLSLAQHHLDIPDKQFINCICIDPCSNQLQSYYVIVTCSLLSGDNMGKVRFFDLRTLDDRRHSRREVISSNSTNNPQSHYELCVML